MTTDPKKSLTPASVSDVAKSDIDQLLQTGLADFSLRELLGLLISSTGAAERNLYLEKISTDKPNGFYDRSLQLGTIPVEVRVPRTRTGEFRPTSLPPLYRRGYSEEVQSMLLGLLGLEPLDQCGQRCASKDGTVPLGTGSGACRHQPDRRIGASQ